MHKYSKEEMIREAKRADDKSDDPLTLKDFIRISGIKEWRIKDMFPGGGWSELKRLAKIKTESKHSKKLSREKFIPKSKAISKKKDNIKELVIDAEDIIIEEDVVSEEDIMAEKAAAEKAAEEEAAAIKAEAKEAAEKEAAAIKAAAIKAAEKEAVAEKAAAEKAAEKEAAAIKAAAIKAAEEEAVAEKAAAEKAAEKEAAAIKAAAKKAAEEEAVAEKTAAEKQAAEEEAAAISPAPQSKTGIKETDTAGIAEFGELIDFRGLRHAPINQNGVIFLFGMVSRELGFIVEAVHDAFPDCEAKRDIGENRYQRVRIKFEYKSSDFKSKGHEPAGADIIICWIHDWPDSPLEVLELKSTLEELNS